MVLAIARRNGIALEGADDAEKAALRDSAGRVAARLAERVRGRLEPLLLA